MSILSRLFGTLEMSKYIDVEKYDHFERDHPFYQEMIKEMIQQVQKHLAPGKKTNILEIGCGTGIFTEELIQIPNIHLDAVDIDRKCCSFLSNKLKKAAKGKNSTLRVINADGTTFSRRNNYHIVISSFAHDHIHYKKSLHFAENIQHNLKEGGVYIVGNELLHPFSNNEERIRSLRNYHGYIIHKAILEGHEELAKLEMEALISGIHLIGDFKRFPGMLEEEFTDYSMTFRKKIGPLDNSNVGGVYVYVFKKK